MKKTRRQAQTRPHSKPRPQTKLRKKAKPDEEAAVDEMPVEEVPVVMKSYAPEIDASRLMVAIVGRPNVGKSALFNRLAGKNIAIVHDRPGVTRDRLVAQCRKGVATFDIMDTGGIGANVDLDFGAQVQAEAQLAIKIADLILLVVDGFEGSTPVDQQLAETLRRTHKPLILVVNKMDNEKRRHIGAEFTRYGFPDTMETSAEHGLGVPDLIARICQRLNLTANMDAAVAPADFDDDLEEEKSPAPKVKRLQGPLKLAIVGRPNAGKSSLINALLGAQRTIVSPIAGTTRDAIDIPFEMKGRKYLLIDTAGMRRKAKVHDTVEVFSTQSATRSIKRADICVLMVDCAEGPKMQDRKIAQLIVEQRRPCILVMNKFDLFHPNGKMSARLEELKEWAEREFFFMRHAPLIPLSAKHGQNLDKLFSAVQSVVDGAQNAPGTGVLNRILQRAIARALEPIGTSGKSFKLLYATIAKNDHNDVVPVPEFVLFGNRVDKLQDSYLRYLEDRIRDEWPAVGIPFKFAVRGKEKDKDRKK